MYKFTKISEYLFLLLFLCSCGVGEALQGKKRSDQGDEFLIDKKNPLVLPPDFDKLPEPGEANVKPTKIIENKTVMINDQFIGELKGLKLELDLKIGALDTDIKSLKKAARQNVSPEILKRIDQILSNNDFELRNDFKIYWNENSIASLYPGKDYLNPQIKLIIDDMIDNSDQKKLQNFIEKWLEKKIKLDLVSLFDLKILKNNNPMIRAIAYQLYENNGVVKREKVAV